MKRICSEGRKNSGSAGPLEVGRDSLRQGMGSVDSPVHLPCGNNLHGPHLIPHSR